VINNVRSPKSQRPQTRPFKTNESLPAGFLQKFYHLCPSNPASQSASHAIS
jgi:hypothetical protein